MHELGVLMQAVRTADRIAGENNIKHIEYLTLEVGKDSGYLPLFFEKLYPVAIEKYPVMQGSQLKCIMTEGKNLAIKDIGYRK